jgi:hypothetical protein
VDEHVAESGHLAEAFREVRVEESRAGQESEELAIRRRLTQALVGDDVGGDVERGLDRDLQRVLDEALVSDVPPDVGGRPERAKLPDAGLDLGELLRDQVGIGQRGLAGASAPVFR